MAINLIGVHRGWTGEPLPSPLADRFAAALGIADSRPAQLRHAGDALIAITGKNGGWQPYRAPCGSTVLFAGSIDNRTPLAFELGVPVNDDGALYAAGFAAWGQAIDLRAMGSFASIVVRPGSEVIHLARSPIIAPPLHYHHDSQRFIAASLSHALFATDEIERRLDHQKIADALALNKIETLRSWYLDVSRLPCGHRATVTRDGVEVEPYYDLAQVPEVRLANDREYEQAALALLQEGVEAALGGFSRPSVCLSGGYDSQAIAAFAARSRPGKPLETFTSVPEAGWDGQIDPGYIGNERPFVEALAAQYSEIRTNWIDCAGLPLDHKVETLFLLSGMSPQNVSNLGWSYEISASARRAGCDVMLDGMGGNLTFSFAGQGAMPALALSGRWDRLWRDAAPINPARSGLANFAIQGFLPLVPRWLFKRIIAFKPDAGRQPLQAWSAIHPDFAERMRVEERAVELGADPLFRVPTSTKATRLEMVKNYDGDGADTMQAHTLLHGVEFRHPALYRPLLEFCFGIPDDQYVRRGQTRWLARQMLTGLVPDIVRENRLTGAQTADWQLRLYRQRGDLIDQIDRLHDHPIISGILDLDSMRQSLIDLPATPLLGSDADYPSMAIPRGIALAGFIRFMEGSNR